VEALRNPQGATFPARSQHTQIRVARCVSLCIDLTSKACMSHVEGSSEQTKGWCSSWATSVACASVPPIAPRKVPKAFGSAVRNKLRPIFAMGNTSSSTPLSDVLSGIQGIVGWDTAKPVASPTYPLFINEVSRKGEQPADVATTCASSVPPPERSLVLR
jgi:hypothetical protein